MAEKQIDYYVAMISPWAYLGSQRIVKIAQKAGAKLNITPIDFGQVFPASGGLPLARRAPQRQAYRLVELNRWRKWLDIQLNLQPKFFPANERLAALMVVAARESGQDAVRLANFIMSGVWAGERNIADEATLIDIATTAGLDGAKLLKAATSEATQKRYQADTEAAIARGVFGAPSYVYRDEIFWGQDRLEFLERALKD